MFLKFAQWEHYRYMGVSPCNLQLLGDRLMYLQCSLRKTHVPAIFPLGEYQEHVKQSVPVLAMFLTCSYLFPGTLAPSENNTRLQEVAPPIVPCGNNVCHCPLPDMEDDDTAHLSSRTSRKVISGAQKEMDQRLGVTPSQRHGMRMPPPHTSAWQDRPPTPENIQRKQAAQQEQLPNEPGPSKPPQ